VAALDACVAFEADGAGFVEGPEGGGLVALLQELGLAEVTPGLEVVGVGAVLDEADLAAALQVVLADDGPSFQVVLGAGDAGLGHGLGPVCHGATIDRGVARKIEESEGATVADGF